jgi:hypothetical protein
MIRVCPDNGQSEPVVPPCKMDDGVDKKHFFHYNHGG